MPENKYLYQKLLTLIVAAFALVSLVALSACSSTSSTTSPTTTTSTSTSPPTTNPTQTQQADDIVTTPGGWAYRANVTQQGQNNPFQAIQVTDTVLTSGTGGVHVMYRSDIVTKANEVRNNIIQVSLLNLPTGAIPIVPLSVNLSLVGVPAGMTVTVGDQGYSPFSTQRVLTIKTASTITLGDYMFSISVQAGGRDYGSVSCTVHVQQ
ncbi:MAG TPA: hypothetical protein VF318_00220 [Dehalococcoidales bacterium]